MEPITFDVEYHSDTPELTDALKAKFEKRLQKLTKRNRDITGASVAIHTVSGDTNPREYRARVVLYQKPENTAATTKDTTVTGALASSLDAVERQVRELREKRRHQWKRP